LLSTITIDVYPGTGKYVTVEAISDLNTTTGVYATVLGTCGNVERWIVIGVDGTVTPGGKIDVGILVGNTVVSDGLTTIV